MSSRSFPGFLDHPGSAVATEIAGRDWGATSLGPLDRWPVSLRTTLATVLGCPAPMVLAWGPDLLVFHNDACLPVLGHRAEGATGRPFRELWASLWGEIGPPVEDALAGRGTEVADIRLDLARTGKPQESYWSFACSPAFDDDGAVAGVLCIIGETTGRVRAEREAQAADERLRLALSAGNSIGIWDWDVGRDLVRADARFASLHGVDPAEAAAGVPVATFVRGLHPDDLPRVRDAIERATRGDGEFQSEYRLPRGDGAERWVSAQGRCIHDPDGRVARILGVSFDVSDRVAAEVALKAAVEEREFVIALTAHQRALLDPRAIVRLSTETLGRRLGVNRVGFYRLLGSDRMQHATGWADGVLMSLVGEQPVSAFGAFAERERASGRTLVFSDSRHDHEGSLQAYADDGVLAGLCVPLLDEGRWAAGIYLHHASVRRWTGAEISLAKEIAGLTWLAVERAEAVVRLNQRLDQQEAALSDAAGEIAAQTRGRSEAEGQVRQLQKMEAVGQLTGGIAHDFNNMLAIVIGGLNLAQRRLARGDAQIGRYLDSALEGATRAALLTQRLLAFSRQQPLSPEPVDANRLVGGLTELLTRTLGERVSLETVLAAGLWKARADLNQLENVLVNLAVNGRDAMPEGGRLTIETGNASVDDDYAREADIKAGQYVMIAVSDTGTGMTPEVLARAFDPFFTTKGVGKGTGLGLSQVFGFVRQSGGHVRIYSEVGYGTTVRLYLPRFWGEVKPTPPRVPAAARDGAPTEIVLVVEDDERVRTYTVEALREFGYTVLHAASGPEALRMIERGQDVTLLFTDIVMPDMTGRELADLALALRPALKVLYTTGYTRNAVVHNGVLDPGTNFIAKPFGVEQLAAKVRDVLGSVPAGPQPR